MKRILFIVNSGEISPNANGGASVYYSHLELLYKAGYIVDLLAVQWSSVDPFIEEDYKEVTGFVRSIDSCKMVSNKPIKNLKRIYNAVFKPEIFEYYFLNETNQKYLKNNIKEKKIDIVWAEWRWTGIWACFSQLSIPVIYAHHDWEYKLAKLRTKRNLLQKFHTFQKKRIEYKLVKQVAGSISGSFTEAQEIEKIAAKKTIYIPTLYEVVNPKLKASNVTSVIHLGGMGTTANRLGLERFLDVCWEEIHQQYPMINLIIIGSLKHAPASLLEKLKKPNIICKGFVTNLETVLRPYDIHIIPWEHNTGTRTRIPVVLNYAQVLVATKASVMAFPELKHNKNAILCDDLEMMTIEISLLINQSDKRKSLSKEGKKTFLNHFTSDKYIEKIKNFIDELL